MDPGSNEKVRCPREIYFLDPFSQSLPEAAGSSSKRTTSPLLTPDNSTDLTALRSPLLVFRSYHQTNQYRPLTLNDFSVSFGLGNERATSLDDRSNNVSEQKTDGLSRFLLARSTNLRVLLSTFSSSFFLSFSFFFLSFPLPPSFFCSLQILTGNYLSTSYSPDSDVSSVSTRKHLLLRSKTVNSVNVSQRCTMQHHDGYLRVTDRDRIGFRNATRGVIATGHKNVTPKRTAE